MPHELPEEQDTTTGVENFNIEACLAASRRPHATIIWAAREPHRLGQTAELGSRCLIGRGGRREDDVAPRAVFNQQRPGDLKAAAPLSLPSISRVQLLCEPSGPNAVRLRKLGRSPLLHNGVEVTEAIVRAGDTFSFKNTMSFLLEQRPRTIAARRLEGEPHDFGKPDPYGLVGESPAAWQLRDEIRIAAESSQHVLIVGESGSGKELVAKMIHALTSTPSLPLVSRNAATLPASLVDAELFGSARHYPNSSSPERVGLIGEADGGSLFLDEIGELPAEHQTHLLRVMDSGGEYQRLGESKSRRSRFRLIAATNRDPQSLKHDLLARFPVRIHVPDLNQRLCDIPLLVRAYLREMQGSSPGLCEQFVTDDTPPGELRIAPNLIEALVRHPYRHHVREVNRLVWLSLSTSPGNLLVVTDSVAEALSDADRAEPFEPTPKQVEEALRVAGGNKSKAAQLLGLKNRFALYRLLNKQTDAQRG